jgi:hypothetical protein
MAIIPSPSYPHSSHAGAGVSMPPSTVDGATAALFTDLKRSGAFDLKRVGHTLLDSCTGSKEAMRIEPEDLGSAAQWLIENLEDFDKEHPLLPALKALCEQERTLAVRTTATHELALKVHKQLQELAPGKSLLLTGGFKGHYMLYEWRREEKGLYTFHIYNSEAMLPDVQEAVIIKDKLLIRAAVSFCRIPFLNLFPKGVEGDDYLQDLIVFRRVDTPINTLYEAASNHLTTYRTAGVANLITPQRSETCSYSALLACLCNHMDRPTYKRFIIDAKMKGFGAAFASAQATLSGSSRQRHILRVAARALTYRLRKELCKAETKAYPDETLNLYLDNVNCSAAAVETAEKALADPAPLSYKDLGIKDEIAASLAEKYTIETAPEGLLAPFTSFLFLQAKDGSGYKVAIPDRSLLQALASKDGLEPLRAFPEPREERFDCRLFSFLPLSQCLFGETMCDNEFLICLYLLMHNHYAEAFNLIPDSFTISGQELFDFLSRAVSEATNNDPEACAIALKMWFNRYYKSRVTFASYLDILGLFLRRFSRIPRSMHLLFDIYFDLNMRKTVGKPVVFPMWLQYFHGKVVENISAAPAEKMARLRRLLDSVS